MNSIIEDYLKSLESIGISTKAHRSVLRRYTTSLNGNGHSSDSALDFLKGLKGPSPISLNVYRRILERFLSWKLGYGVTLDCPWIKESLNKHMREYYRNFPAARQVKAALVRSCLRKSYTFTLRDGKQVYIKARKRPRPPDICELCGKLARKLDYHHWDDEDLTKGMWLCSGCHRTVAGLVDKQGLGTALWLIEKYVRLKTEIDLTCGRINEQN